MKRAGDRLVLAALVVNIFLAGGNAIAIRFSNRELQPFWGAGLRFMVAGALLAVAMVAMRKPLPRGRALAGAALFGLFQFSGAFGLYYFALVRIHAGIGQTILALVPLATLLLAAAQGQGRITSLAVAGSALGIGGIAVISNGSFHGSFPIVSLIAVFGSVLCFAQAAVIIRRFPPVHPVALNGVGMVVGASVLLLVSLLRGEAATLPESPETWIALAYVALLGSIPVFLIYVFIIARWGAARASYVMVLLPFVTITLSARLDAEPLGPGLLLGGLLVIVGVYLGALRGATNVPQAPSSTGG